MQAWHDKKRLLVSSCPCIRIPVARAASRKSATKRSFSEGCLSCDFEQRHRPPMPTLAPTSPLTASSLQNQLLMPKVLERPSHLCFQKSFQIGASIIGQKKHQRSSSQMRPQPHLSERGLQARNVQSKAAYQTDAQQTSSSVTRTKGSNGWAWVLGGLTLTAGTSAPALYIGSHWNEVRFFAYCFIHCGFAEDVC